MGVTQRTASLGVGQSWQDVTVSRAVSTTYTNTTGKPIQLAIQASGFSQFQMNGTVMPVYNGTAPATFQWIVPPGATYVLIATAITYWFELR